MKRYIWYGLDYLKYIGDVIIFRLIIWRKRYNKQSLNIEFEIIKKGAINVFESQILEKRKWQEMMKNEIKPEKNLQYAIILRSKELNHLLIRQWFEGIANTLPILAGPRGEDISLMRNVKPIENVIGKSYESKFKKTFFWLPLTNLRFHVKIWIFSKSDGQKIAIVTAHTDPNWTLLFSRDYSQVKKVYNSHLPVFRKSFTGGSGNYALGTILFLSDIFALAKNGARIDIKEIPAEIFKIAST